MKKAQKNCRGSAMVEFALGFPLLVLLLTGVFQWGYTFYTYNVLASNVRAGARYAAQKAFVPSTGTSSAAAPCPAWVTSVQNMVVYGTPSPADNAAPVVPGLTRAHIAVEPVFDASGVPLDIRVGVSTTTPYPLNAVLTGYNLRGKPSVSFPFTGIYTPAATCN